MMNPFEVRHLDALDVRLVFLLKLTPVLHPAELSVWQRHSACITVCAFRI